MPPFLHLHLPSLPLLLFLLLTFTPTLAQQPSDLESLRFSGTYLNTGPHPLFHYLDQPSGNLDIYFSHDTDSRDQPSKPTIAILELLNPKYHDLKVIDLLIHLQEYDKEKHEWRSENGTIDVYSYYKENKNSETLCAGWWKIGFEQEGDGMQEWNWDVKTMVAQVEFVGTGDNRCEFKFTATARYVDQKYKILGYCGFVTLILLIQITCAFKLMNQLTSNEISADKLSLLTISIITIQDFYLTMMHMYFLMTQNRFYQYFILPIFLLVTMSIVFDMRLLFTVWRAKYIHEINNGELRKKITVFYIQFYLGMFGYLMLMFFFTYEIWPLYLQAFIFTPQIIHNVRKGNNPKFYSFFILGVLGMRVILPVYYRGCPDNIYMIEPNLTFCYVWCSLFGVQILTLLVQKICGPRFFIPKKLIPGHYQYVRKMDGVGMEDMECNICLQEIFREEGAGEGGINESFHVPGESLISSKKKNKVTVMRTPCNHIFHPECLRHWIDVKLECPSCRLVLPPIM